MLIAPLAFLLSWLAGLLSLGLLIGGPAVLWTWYAGAVVGTGYLVAGRALVLWALAGRWVALLLLSRGGCSVDALAAPARTRPSP